MIAIIQILEFLSALTFFFSSFVTMVTFRIYDDVRSLGE
ncbi:hypothetical protein Ab1vBOLIVR5_gp172 [Agrobacterium phage OLIVR5]|uniref:Uncharacterized protein n=1 Tax=Agrobacterium phage OLIVR5 TaxID=2723773 RepID=A0A858MV41_9CAUD|nr:hypothetical protein KNU99_gp229 [Agrobacterium phage OLIVR5]QIW87820.1 hypothetical protein Ab1vBOLIVR5_gp172 [Agrobacterium phage OLIVR5]QIW88085.1 hypothetical protein Ab1vBOLIVR6_gp178 [Agrobacterium phage OLIVR6]